MLMQARKLTVAEMFTIPSGNTWNSFRCGKCGESFPTIIEDDYGFYHFREEDPYALDRHTSITAYGITDGETHEL